MEKLPGKYVQHEYLSCLSLTDVMKRVIIEQHNIYNGHHNTPFYFHNGSYNTQCDEFQSFMKSINENPNNRTLINCNSRNVAVLVTKVNTKLDVVEFILE